MVEALRALVKEALRDPMNQRFQLLCEYSLPLQSPLLVYQQFIKEPKSRLNACNTWDWQEHVSAMLAGRPDTILDGHHVTDSLIIEPQLAPPCAASPPKRLYCSLLKVMLGCWCCRGQTARGTGGRPRCCRPFQRRSGARAASGWS